MNIFTLDMACNSTEAGQEEMSTMLLLLLGAAVHCEHKVAFVETIKDRLDIEVQHCIVAAIQQVGSQWYFYTPLGGV